ncbi:MAG: hypothetical protein Kow0032_15780 [Methyloligellaceae bacterium]
MSVFPRALAIVFILLAAAGLSAVAPQGASASPQTDYLEANKRKPGVRTTRSGLQYRVIREGNGRAPGANDEVEVHYKGWLINGQVFDSSYARGQTISFPLSGVIPGWTEGLQLMREGAKYELVIPSSLAYGARGAGGVIPPHATLIFEVELIRVK